MNQVNGRCLWRVVSYRPPSSAPGPFRFVLHITAYVFAASLERAVAMVLERHPGVRVESAVAVSQRGQELIVDEEQS